MQFEYDSLIANDTWTLVPLPLGKKLITTKMWVFRTKVTSDGTLEQLKVRLVACEFEQKCDLDCHEMLSLTIKWSTIRMITSTIAWKQWQLMHLDVKATHLNGTLIEKVYITQPQGFEVDRKNELICTLKRTIYGLRLSKRVWYTNIDSYITQLGLRRIDTYHNLYIRITIKGLYTILVLYVDDIMLTGDNIERLLSIKGALQKRYKMSHLGQLKLYIGL